MLSSVCTGIAQDTRAARTQLVRPRPDLPGAPPRRPDASGEIAALQAARGLRIRWHAPCFVQRDDYSARRQEPRTRAPRLAGAPGHPRHARIQPAVRACPARLLPARPRFPDALPRAGQAHAGGALRLGNRSTAREGHRESRPSAPAAAAAGDLPAERVDHRALEGRRSQSARRAGPRVEERRLRAAAGRGRRHDSLSGLAQRHRGAGAARKRAERRPCNGRAGRQPVRARRTELRRRQGEPRGPAVAGRPAAAAALDGERAGDLHLPRPPACRRVAHPAPQAGHPRGAGAHPPADGSGRPRARVAAAAVPAESSQSASRCRS